MVDASADADSVLRQAHAIIVAALADRLSGDGAPADTGKAALELLSAATGLSAAHRIARQK